LQQPDALVAVALQDHLMKNLNVNLSLPNIKKKPNLDQRLLYRKPKAKAVVNTNIRTSQQNKNGNNQKLHIFIY